MYREGIVKDNDAVDSYVSSALLHLNTTQLHTTQDKLQFVLAQTGCYFKQSITNQLLLNHPTKVNE